ncbi:hypothetical protein AArc1_3067 [Natrarchaeobaculum sulfurireducens]|uniref:Uncharacterized protein n=1 Tax=Natrarchaeobaculum sulfurireducens TaxID=2044521 RepID=A0A346PIM8_9EURY|nr:hypothetical protein AArc1_3067 [Natrarchaeobaculum sulfurireducens]
MVAHAVRRHDSHWRSSWYARAGIRTRGRAKLSQLSIVRYAHPRDHGRTVSLTAFASMRPP